MITALLLFFIAACCAVGFFGPDIEALLGPAGIKIVLGIMGVLTVVLYIIKDIGNSSSSTSSGGYSVDELEEFDMMDEDK